MATRVRMARGPGLSVLLPHDPVRADDIAQWVLQVRCVPASEAPDEWVPPVGADLLCVSWAASGNWWDGPSRPNLVQAQIDYFFFWFSFSFYFQFPI